MIETSNLLLSLLRILLLLLLLLSTTFQFPFSHFPSSPSPSPSSLAQAADNHQPGNPQENPQQQIEFPQQHPPVIIMSTTAAAAAAIRIPPVFISHGGPNLYLQKEAAAHKFYKRFGEEIRKTYPNLKAIVIVSAHWEVDHVIKVNVSPNPQQIYDFYGFPKEMYDFKYRPKGHPEVANRAIELLQKAGIKALPDPDHGLDHGTWSPLSISFPKADIPIVQISLHSSLEPRLHIEIGKALAPLQFEGVMLVGSGSVTHNLGMLRTFKGPESDTSLGNVEPNAKGFEDHLSSVVTGTTGTEREELIRKIYSHPLARMNHPSTEHLAPIFFSVGAALENPGKVIFSGFMYGGLSMTCYSF